MKYDHGKCVVVGFRRVHRGDGKIREVSVRWCSECGAVFTGGDRWVYPRSVKR